jgi:hypothetical protein
MRGDVNTLPDPRTYAAVSGFFGTAPDEMGFSVMHPDREGIKRAGQVGFGVGTALQVAPIVGGMMKLANIGPSTGGKTTAASQLGAIKVPGRASEPIFTPIPSADAPFVGRLDEMVANLQGPVQKDQFLGMLKGKMRDYDIARAEQTLADLPGNAKLTPVDLLNRIKTQYDPSQFKTTITPPAPAGFYQQTDNPYFTETGGGPPLGVIHLSQATDPALAQVQQVADGARVALSKLDSRFYEREWSPQVADDLLQAADSPALALSEGTANGMRSLATQYRQLAAQENALERARSDMIYPAASPDYIRNTMAYQQELRNQGVDTRDAFQQANIRATRESIERGNNFLRANKLPPVEMPNLAELDNPPMWALDSTPQAKSLREETLALFDIARAPLLTARTNLIAPANEVSASFRKEIGHLIPYQGQHTVLNNPANPISFSRFSEHTTDIPGIGKADGIYVNELQSDRLDDLRKLGPKGGSRQKDEEEFRRVRETLQSTAEPGSTEAARLQSRRRVLDQRRASPESQYSLPESFAGMETSPQVAQQLMVKNAVSGAMQMGKQFVAFPGAESKQAQLYEKLGPNLKSVVKDLGPGFELRDVTLRDPDGKQLMHKAIVWGPEAASRVQKKGVPFKDGGAVERQTADHRKYL